MKVKIHSEMMIHFISIFSFSATGALVCDPPCGRNAVCQNNSGIAECVCADGFNGEENCTGKVGLHQLDVNENRAIDVERATRY